MGLIKKKRLQLNMLGGANAKKFFSIKMLDGADIKKLL